MGGPYSLSLNGANTALLIAAAGEYAGDVRTGLRGMQGATILADFRYGAGGTDVKAFLQTSLDDGAFWFDVACFRFTLADARKVFNFETRQGSGIFVPAVKALDYDTVIHGPIGDRLKLVAVSTGTYTGDTALDVRFLPR